MHVEHSLSSGRYRGTRDAFRSILREDGVAGLWKGWAPNCQRAALVCLGGKICLGRRRVYHIKRWGHVSMMITAWIGVHNMEKDVGVAMWGERERLEAVKACTRKRVLMSIVDCTDHLTPLD